SQSSYQRETPGAEWESRSTIQRCCLTPGCRGRNRRPTAREGEGDAERIAKAAHPRYTPGQAGKGRVLNRRRLTGALHLAHLASAAWGGGSFQAFCRTIGSKLHQRMQHVA